MSPGIIQESGWIFKFKELQKINTGQIILVIMEIETSKKIAEVYNSGHEALNRIINAISYVSFGKSQHLQHVGTWKKVDENEFHVLLSNVIVKEDVNRPVILDSICNVINAKNIERAIACISSSLRAENIEEGIVLAHSSAQELAKADGGKDIISKCNNCGHEANTGRISSTEYIKNLGQGEAEESRLKLKKFIELRNKISHGLTIRELADVEMAMQALAVAQSLIVRRMDQMINIPREIFNRLIISRPYGTYNCHILNKMMAGISDMGRMPIMMAKVRESEPTGYMFEIGMETPINWGEPETSLLFG